MTKFCQLPSSGFVQGQNSFNSTPAQSPTEFYSHKSGIFQISCVVLTQGAWQIFNAKQLTFIPGALPQQSQTIISLSSNQLQTSKNISISPGKIFILTKTWDRQYLSCKSPNPNKFFYR